MTTTRHHFRATALYSYLIHLHPDPFPSSEDSPSSEGNSGESTARGENVRDTVPPKQSLDPGGSGNLVEYVGRVLEFPSLSYLALTPELALRGIRHLLADTLADMQERGEDIPSPTNWSGTPEHTLSTVPGSALVPPRSPFFRFRIDHGTVERTK